MKIDFLERTALLIGSGGPIAVAVADALAGNGAKLSQARYDPAGRRPVGSDPTAALDISENTAAGPTRFGSPWLLVAIHPGAERPPADDHLSDAAEWDASDLSGLVRAFAPNLRRVVSVISVAGLVPMRANPLFSVEQAGLAAMTRALAMEWGRAGVSVNAVAVGAFEDKAAAVGAGLLSHTALRRPARISEIVAAVLFLADPDNTYTTGHVATVDGGFTAGYARNF